MYPYIRYTKSIVDAIINNKKGQPLAFDHVSEVTVRCSFTDIDPMFEMNNGRVLTVYDIGRTDFIIRTGLAKQLLKNRWGMVVAGSTIQYRKRIRLFDKVTIKTQLVGMDERWLYLEHSMWVKGKPCSSVLLRTGVTEKGRVIEMARVLSALGLSAWDTPTEPWIQDWIDSDKAHRWPPMGEMV
ncbi:acyl-CoA thioesterase [Psychrobacter sp. DM4]|uniref:acyl-CoA thioesterase n=1 Tax=Psychrobacter sp. DM4 TaxID=3440637 RepID=UPI003F504F41